MGIHDEDVAAVRAASDIVQIVSEYTPLRNRGCHCGADFDGRDCMCFEDY